MKEIGRRHQIGADGRSVDDIVLAELLSAARNASLEKIGDMDPIDRQRKVETNDGLHITLYDERVYSVSSEVSMCWEGTELIGLTVDEVELLLGPPSEASSPMEELDLLMLDWEDRGLSVAIAEGVATEWTLYDWLDEA